MFNRSLNSVVPTDVRIYYEDKKPYIEYRGITQDCRGDKVEIYLPKINLNISAIEYIEEYNNHLVGLNVTFSGQHDKMSGPIYIARTIERTMTKAQIEKELGYKIKICE